MTIYDQQGKIVEKKFYHSEWAITELLKARNDGLITDEGEAWKYRYSHMDGTGGKYDMLFRREPVAIEAPAQEPADSRPSNCRFRLADEGKPYPRSSCQACGKNILTGLGNSCKNATTQPDNLTLVAPVVYTGIDLARDGDTHVEGYIEDGVFHETKRVNSPAPDAVQEAAKVLLIALERAQIDMAILKMFFNGEPVTALRTIAGDCK